MAIARFRLRRNIHRKCALGSLNCLCIRRAVAATAEMAVVVAMVGIAVTAAVVAVFLATPHWRAKLMTKRKQKGGA